MVNMKHDTAEARRLADELAADMNEWTMAAAAMLSVLADERDSLRAQVEALRADAERYRFMRDTYISQGQHKQIMYAVDELSEHLMDAAIDAARSQEAAG